MERATTDADNEHDFSIAGVVVMKGHPHHPTLHHHGLGELSVASSRVRLLTFRAMRSWRNLLPTT
jgi:hypothetical protein